MLDRSKILNMAREAGGTDKTSLGVVQFFIYELERFAVLVAADERESCAKAAGWLWQQFKDTKEAHERNSMEPFMPGKFGFNLSTVQQSKIMMDAIRARGEQ